jgi:hypothetical protein
MPTRLWSRAVFVTCSLLAALPLAALHTAAAPAPDGSPQAPYPVHPAAGPITIDGTLDDPGWAAALVLELRYEVDPLENVPAPVRTEVLLTHDERCLYAAFRCFDPEPRAIRARLTDREDFWSDDHANIHIDTFNDERRNFSIGANPCGVQMDGVATNGMHWDWSWDAIWDSAARIHDWGWALEMAVPFAQLAFPRSDGPLIWGFDAWRIYPRDVQHYLSIIPWDRNDACWQCKMVKIEGFAGARPGRDIELTPTLTSVRTDARDELPDGRFRRAHEQTELGLTAQWGPLSNVNAAGTYNPDFSQVEADALQLDINEPFALYYEERRPFFTEGADFFQTPKSIFYSRTLRDPLWGTKLTGKANGHTFGACLVRDEVTNLLFPGNQSSQELSLEQDVTAAVLRYRRDIGSRHGLGVMATSRRGEGYHNTVLSLDGELHPTSRDRILVQVQSSDTRYPETVVSQADQPHGDFGGGAVALDYDHEARILSWWAYLEQVEGDFRADLAYRPRVDYRGADWGGYRAWYGDSWWNTILWGLEFEWEETLLGGLLRRNAETWLQIYGTLQSSGTLVLVHESEVYAGRRFEKDEARASLGFQPAAEFQASLYLAYGDHVDYANTQLGERLRIGPSVQTDLGRHLRLSFDHTYERLNVEAGRLYTANVSELRAVFQFDVRTFFRAILQHVLYDRHPESYTAAVDRRTQRLFTQLLFSYKLNPRTLLFLGYTDTYQGSQDYDLAQADRTVFAKLGYAWGL